MSLSGALSLHLNSDKRCPYLGLHDDPATAEGFPSKRNYCHGVHPPIPPSLMHQQEFCLTTKYGYCPAIENGQKQSLPEYLQRREIGTIRKLIRRMINKIVI